MTALALFLLARAFKTPPALRDALLIGAVCGLCALSKVSGIAMVALALVSIGYVNRKDRHQLLIQTLAILATFVLVAGWWYLRNLGLYGEITGTARMLEI